MIKAIGLVVPAHDEEELLPGCLAALRRAAQRAGARPVHTLVVADACGDRTAQRARAAGAEVVEIQARRVGSARAAGFAAALRRHCGPDRSRVWLATTDADTLVPPHWLARQISYAEMGWDTVLGTVTVSDWSGHPGHVPDEFAARYAHEAESHPHVHGANLGVRASAYLAAGGFRALDTGEDHALVAALEAAGRPILRSTDLAVETSARHQARAPDGFGHLLTTLTSPGTAWRNDQRSAACSHRIGKLS
jgi:glycosyltransferase involved in cell wall biosynthesis